MNQEKGNIIEFPKLYVLICGIDLANGIVNKLK